MTYRPPVLAPLGALASALVAVALGPACASSSSDAFFGGGYQLPNTSDANSGGASSFSSGSSSSSPGISTSNPLEGNPLCNASHYAGRCYPDDPITAQACAIAPDGSADYDLDAGYGDAAVSCHVVPLADADAGVGPACQAAGTHVDGQS